MTIPDELRYTAEHEWVSISGSVASVGITDYAQQALGDVVYVSVPAPGSRVTVVSASVSVVTPDCSRAYSISRAKSLMPPSPLPPAARPAPSR